MPTLWRSQLWAMSGHDALKSDVRFAPESGHWWAQLVSPRLETAPNYSAITAGNPPLQNPVQQSEFFVHSPPTG
jgi:hypothetical protein